MFDEIFQSIRAQLYDRAVSPLAGSFIISWCLWNYKFFLIIFSNLSVDAKFDKIGTVIFPDPDSLLIYGVLIPLATSLGYLFLYPYPSKFVFSFTRQRQKELIEIKKTIQGDTLLTKKESRELNQKLFQLEEVYQSEIERKDNLIKELNGALSEAVKANDSISPSEPPDPFLTPESPDPLEDEPINDKKIFHDFEPLSVIRKTSLLKPKVLISNDLSESETTILNFIGRAFQLKASDNEIMNDTDLGQIRIAHDLEELANKDFISYEFDRSNDEVIYSLTQQGRKALIDSGFA